MRAEAGLMRPEHTAGRTLYWALRRELWEHRSIYLAPVTVAALALLAYVMTSSGMEMARRLDSIPPAKQAALLAKPYDGAAIVLVATSLLVAIFYAIDALYGERRDRSILFWKSLPVSDRLTVIAKALVPLAVVPAIAFAVILATQLVMLLIGSALLAFAGASATPLWTNIPHVRNTGVLLYTLVTITLWYAPIYAWCLAVSAWAQRAPLLLAILPWLALSVMEVFILGTNQVVSFVRSRFAGGFDAAFTQKTPVASQFLLPGESVPDPAKFLATPDLWLGLAAAIALLAAAAWLRRREA